MSLTELVFALSLGIAAGASFLIIGLSVRRASPVRFQRDREDIVELATNRTVPPLRHLDAGLLQAVNIGKAVPTHGDGGPDHLVILNNASLAMYPGELICITGDAGRGKSTLLDILALQETPTAGQVVIADTVASALGRGARDAIVARAIHYIPQDNLGILLGRSPLENIMHALTRVDGLTVAEAERRATAALRLAGLPRRKYHQPVTTKGFSGGQRARVAMAIAFARAKPIILADEIFANIDEKSRPTLLEHFRAVAWEQQSVVAIISHDRDLCQRFDRRLDVQGSDPSLSEVDTDLSA